MVSEKKAFVCFPIVSKWELTTPEYGNFDPRGMICRTYVEHHITSLHTEYIGFGSCGLCFSNNKAMVDIHAPGHGKFGTKGHGWQDL